MPNIEVSRAGIPADTGRLLLTITATPGVRSERILDAFGRAGWVVPRGAELERWTAMARANTNGSRSRIAFLRSSGAGIRGELLTAYGAPVVVAIDAESGEDEQAWQEALAGLPLVLLYGGPETALLQAMRDGRSTAEAMDEWLRSTRSMLAAFRADRERVVLIDAERALASPAAFVLACRQRFGMDIPIETLRAEAWPAPSAEEGLYWLLAQRMAARSAEVSQLADELAECALPMGVRITPDLDCELILRDHRTRMEREDRLACELSRMRTLADELDERNEGLETANAALYRELRGVQEALDNACAVTQYLPHAEYEALLNERNEQTQTIGRLQEELVDLEAERAQARIRLSRLEEEVSALRAGRQRLDDEQELLVLQLAQTQDELETTSMRTQELRLREAAQLKRIDELERILKQAGQDRGRAERKLERMERLLALRERRISYIENSQSWRMTAPLRGAIRLFRAPAERKPAS